MIAPGVFEWTSPHGHRYRRDHTGTTRDRPTRTARHPDPPTMTPPHTPPPAGGGAIRLSGGTKVSLPTLESVQQSPIQSCDIISR